MDRPKCGWYANRRLRVQYTFVWCVCVCFFFCLVHNSVHISASILLRALCLFVYFVFRDLFGECGELHFIWLSIWLLRCILKMRIYIQWPLFWRIQIRTVFDIKSMSTKCPRTITHTHRRCTSIVYWFHFLENPIWIGFRLNSCFFLPLKSTSPNGCFDLFDLRRKSPINGFVSSSLVLTCVYLLCICVS